MKIYIASAMFTKKQKARINAIVKVMRKMGHEVYVPYEYKILGGEKMSNAQWAQKNFKAEVLAIDESDAVFYFCEGIKGDISAAWECGYAYAKGKRIFVEELKHTKNISSMVAQCTETKIESYQS